MPSRGEVLVAIMNNKRDMDIAREQNWYRIPVRSVEKFLKRRWPPNWLALYQTKVSGSEAYAVNYYARVQNIRKVYRHELFPSESCNEKTKKRYYKLELAQLQQLPKPIASHRRRRITFIATTLKKLKTAVEINDLYNESPLEEKVWNELKDLGIDAERQEQIRVKERKTYFLDFAIYCTNGNINVETDGDTWHADKDRIPLDNLRGNDLHALGWHTFRFNTHQVQEEMGSYCAPKLVEAINRLGGLGQQGKLVLGSPERTTLEGDQQLNLFQVKPENI